MSGSDLRADVEAALAAGDTLAARDAARAYWRDAPNASVARYLKGRAAQLWPAGLVEHRLAILRAFTVEPVIPLLEAEAVLSGVRLEVWAGDFNAYAQEILDPASGLYAFQPETIILAVETRDIAPALWQGFPQLPDGEIEALANEAAAELVRLVDQLRARSSASLIVHGLARSPTPPDGLLDAAREMTQGEAVQLANQILRGHCRKQSGVWFLDYDELQARHGRLTWSDARKYAVARLPFSVTALPAMAAAWWRHLQALVRPRAKVLVLDLDNTLWGGVLGEDGANGVALGDEPPGSYFRDFQRAIADVAARGVLLGVASKNNPDEVRQMLAEHPHMVLRADAFAAQRVDWNPKAENLIAIARELNVGLDSLVFVDDNPAECDAIRRSLPEVEVVALPPDPSLYADLIRTLPSLERLSAGEEDRVRARYYAEERQRQGLAAQAENLEDFLASLNIEVSITPFTSATIARAAQLTQKTNQLNTTTRRYSEAEIAAVSADPERDGWTLRARDRFGDNGIVGLAIVRREPDRFVIESMLLSCRVIGRGIETALLAFVAEAARAEGRSHLDGPFLPTAKNAPAAAIYERAGFAPAEGLAPPAQLWRFDLAKPLPMPPWVRRERAP